MDKMIDLAIGTKFYYKGRLCEVIELEHEYDYCKCSTRCLRRRQGRAARHNAAVLHGHL